MIQSVNQPNPIVAFIPLVLFTVPLIFVVRKLAIEKGKDVILWTVLACIPIVNIFITWYIVGAPSKIIEDKLDKILEQLNKPESK